MEEIKIKSLDGPRELERLMDIWFESNIDAHNFIDRSYWEANYDYVKEVLPEADLYLANRRGEILGFMGVSESYIAGIFVDKEYRGLGIGSKLIERAKLNYNKLSLDLYKKNKMAYDFYLSKGFKLTGEKLDLENQELEYHMTWKK